MALLDDAISTFIFVFPYLIYIVHIFLYDVAMLPHYIYYVVIFIYFLFSQCAGTFPSQLFYLLCGDVLSISSFLISVYSSYIFVHHSIRHVVMLFSPHFHFMCAGTPLTLFIIPPIMW